MTRRPFDKAITKERTDSPVPNKVKAALPRNIERLARDVITVTKELAKCLKTENEAMENADVSRFLALQEYKIDITQKYNEAMQALLARKDEIKDLPPEQKEELGAVYKNVTALTQENLAGIERMKSSVERLNGHIMSSARRNADKKGVNYSGRGQIQKETRSLSMGINESA